MRDAVAAACAVYAALSAADCAAPVISDDNIVFAISLAKALFFLIRFFLHLFAASIATLSRLLPGYTIFIFFRLQVDYTPLYI